MTSSAWGLGFSTFVAAVVEMVEALTIVLAMGLTRGWRSALAGVAVAVVALVAFTSIAGYALTTWLPRSALQLVVGTLLLIFGLQWLRKAVLRSSGRKAMHDEDGIFAREVDQARAAADETRFGLDWFGFVISLKGVFLEGVEVVFIVITFGLNANDVPVAVVGAVAGALVVIALALVVRGPLARVPENALKYVVGLLLATYGTFWSIAGLGVLRPGRESLAWPGGDVAILVVLAGWFVVTQLLVARLRVEPPSAPRQVEVGERGQV